MSCCTNSTVRTATFSSGLTQQKALAAAQRDQARLLANLQRRVGGDVCCKEAPSQGSAAAASVLEAQHARRCLPTIQQQALFPRAGVTESVRIQKRVDALLAANTNPLNPETRFQQYQPYNPPAPCPPLAPQLQSSTNPKPYFFPGCTPPPIGQRGY